MLGPSCVYICMFSILCLRLILLVNLFFASAIWLMRVYFSVSVLNSYDLRCLDYHPAFNTLLLSKSECFDSSIGLFVLSFLVFGVICC